MPTLCKCNLIFSYLLCFSFCRDGTLHALVMGSVPEASVCFSAGESLAIDVVCLAELKFVAEVDLVVEVNLAAEVDLGVGSNLAADEDLVSEVNLANEEDLVFAVSRTEVNLEEDLDLVAMFNLADDFDPVVAFNFEADLDLLSEVKLVSKVWIDDRVVPLLGICPLRLLCPVISPNMIDGFDFVRGSFPVKIVCMFVMFCLAALCEAASLS